MPAGLAAGAQDETSASARLGALLQNEAGSVLAPHTWRYVPPAAHLIPAADAKATAPAPPINASAAAVASAAWGGAGRACGSQARAQPDGSAAGLAAAAAEALWGAAGAPAGAKRQLVADLVERLVQHSAASEKKLGAEQRANLALRATLEGMQRQNVALQQQLAYVTQSYQSLAAAATQGEAVPALQ
mmetsp:Transcript_71439/g.192377  ORF Transcript_71439/g.192377 Transcript_71439/m.192377 type:complete len:188 (+) Transcript_71439:2-565(+)